MRRNRLTAEQKPLKKANEGLQTMAANKSIEERVEDCGKRWLNSYKCKYYTKTDSINAELDGALKTALSKSGGKGGNYSDIRLLLTAASTKTYPIMIEVKGKRDKLAKLNSNGEIDNTTAKSEPNYPTINGFAVNGAIHYAKAILDHTDSYDEVIAIGLNGYDEAGVLEIELGVYYVSAENFGVPKEIGKYSDLSLSFRKKL